MTDDLRTAMRAALGKVRAGGLVVGVQAGPTKVYLGKGTLGSQPVTKQTVMYGASLTKQIVGLLLARSVAVGQLSDVADLRTWLPELPPWTAGVRLRHLLHHTSGLPDVTADEPGPPWSNAEVIRRLQTCSTRLPRPGISYSYNNAGYVLLAEVLSRVHGRPIQQLAAEQLFDPLAMASTRLGGASTTLSDQPEPPGTIGDGGLWTSAADLITWLTAVNTGWPDPAAVARAETAGSLDDGTSLDYAWGVRVTETRHGRRISHGGTWGGWLAKTVRLPERQIAVAVLSVGSTEDAISALGFDLAALAEQ